MIFEDITVSYVVTVYNKEAYLENTVTSLLSQTGGINSEYIFVDDVSTDGSLAVIERLTKDVHNVVIIRNSDNKGPSTRLNQGARAARGRYLQFIDSDDILAHNATETMLRLLTHHNADVVYGTWEKTGLPGEQLLDRVIPANSPVKTSDSPLEFVLRGRFLRMTQMVKRETYLVSGGCDERIFIQDESLPLRLARVARRFIKLEAPVMFVPHVEGELSRNKSQLNHDRFLANYYMLTDYSGLSEPVKRSLYQRCVSAAWKQMRYEQGNKSYTRRIFWRYLFVKAFFPAPSREKLEKMHRYFADLKGVRRAR